MKKLLLLLTLALSFTMSAQSELYIGNNGFGAEMDLSNQNNSLLISGFMQNNPGHAWLENLYIVNLTLSLRGYISENNLKGFYYSGGQKLILGNEPITRTHMSLGYKFKSNSMSLSIEGGASAGKVDGGEIGFKPLLLIQIGGF